MKQGIARIFAPRSIAIVGASNKKGKVGNMLVSNTAHHGYKGKVFYVNRNGGQIRKQKVYTALSQLPQKVDLVLIAIPGAFVEDVIRDGVDVCTNYIVISAGFGEAGVAGHNREMSLLALADEKNLTILGPNCLGILTPRLGLNASFAPGLPAVGKTAFISQSGALAVALVDKAAQLGIGFSSVASIGNKMQLTETELLNYFIEDVSTEVIAFYLEGIRDGDRFLAACAKARQSGKRVILLKSGRTEAAQKAIALHTGSLAGSDDVLTAACEKVGALRVDTIEDLFDTIRGAMYFRDITHLQKKKCRTVVLTNAGGPGVLSTDFLARAKQLTLATISKNGKDALAAYLPDAASVHNPIDLLGDAATDRYAKGLEVCATEKDVDAVLVLLTPQEQTPVVDIAKALIAAHKKSDKLIMASFIGGERVCDAVAVLQKAGVPHFDTPGQAVRVLDALLRGSSASLPALPKINRERQARVARVLSAHAGARGALYIKDASAIAKIYGLTMSKHWDISTPDGRSTVTYPCVAKVDDPHILHKSDRGGVLLPIEDPTQLAQAFRTLQDRFQEETAQFVAQPLLSQGMELIIGMTRDPIFGPIIVVGLGGIYTEVFKRREFMISPFSEREARKILTDGTLGFLFRETRGQAPYDLDAVVSTVLALEAIARENDAVTAIDINPLLLYNDDRLSTAVDVKIVV